MKDRPLGLCPRCFESADRVNECKRINCGLSDNTGTRSPLMLPFNVVLENQYVFGDVLGQGSFGITYLGFDTKLKRKVAIKEYLPSSVVSRDPGRNTVVPHSRDRDKIFKDGLHKFIEEAQQAAQFNHPNLVRVHTIFEENNTAYMVMDYEEGNTLGNYITEKGGRISPDEALELLLPILDALEEIHTRNLVHRDVKPENIFITNRRKPILLDFGAARVRAGTSSGDQAMTAIFTPGYAPLEQHRGLLQGPYTDIYAFAATMYKSITGEKPPPSYIRATDDTLKPPGIYVRGLDLGINDAILHGLEINPEKRPQSVDEYRQDFESFIGTQQPMLVTFNCVPEQGTAPLTVHFNARESNDPNPGGAIVHHLWNFGDGGTAEGDMVSYTYQAGGTFKVELTVQNNRGADARTFKTISVQSQEEHVPVIPSPSEIGTLVPPLAHFVALPDTGRAPLTVRFDASGSKDPNAGGSISRYEWTVGNAVMHEGAEFHHTFDRAGDYAVTLRVENNNGVTNRPTHTIRVRGGVVVEEQKPPVQIDWGRWGKWGGALAGLAAVLILILLLIPDGSTSASSEDLREIRTLINQKDYRRAQTLLRPMIEDNNPEVLYLYGRSLEGEAKSRADTLAALEWYKKAAPDHAAAASALRRIQ